MSPRHVTMKTAIPSSSPEEEEKVSPSTGRLRTWFRSLRPSVPCIVLPRDEREREEEEENTQRRSELIRRLENMYSTQDRLCFTLHCILFLKLLEQPGHRLSVSVESGDVRPSERSWRMKEGRNMRLDGSLYLPETSQIIFVKVSVMDIEGETVTSAVAALPFLGLAKKKGEKFTSWRGKLQLWTLPESQGCKPGLFGTMTVTLELESVWVFSSRAEMMKHSLSAEQLPRVWQGGGDVAVPASSVSSCSGMKKAQDRCRSGSNRTVTRRIMDNDLSLRVQSQRVDSRERVRASLPALRPRTPQMHHAALTEFKIADDLRKRSWSAMRPQRRRTNIGRRKTYAFDHSASQRTAPGTDDFLLEGKEENQ